MYVRIISTDLELNRIEYSNTSNSIINESNDTKAEKFGENKIYF